MEEIRGLAGWQTDQSTASPAPQMYKNTGWALILLDSQWGARRDINIASHWKLSEWKHAFAFWPVRNLKKALMDLLFLYPCRVNKIRSYSQNHCVAHQLNSWCSYYTCHRRGVSGFLGVYAVGHLLQLPPCTCEHMAKSKSPELEIIQ